MKGKENLPIKHNNDDTENFKPKIKKIWHIKSLANLILSHGKVGVWKYIFFQLNNDKLALLWCLWGFVKEIVAIFSEDQWKPKSSFARGKGEKYFDNLMGKSRI